MVVCPSTEQTNHGFTIDRNTKYKLINNHHQNTHNATLTCMVVGRVSSRQAELDFVVQSFVEQIGWARVVQAVTHFVAEGIVAVLE